MFVIILNYVAGLEKIDIFLDEHVAFLDKYYAKQIFLLSGRKEPRNGGVILAHQISKEELQDILKEDPFHRERLADYDIIEFIPSMKTKSLETILQ